jgi:DNA uptake protein ComE-like DNA-binding protein
LQIILNNHWQKAKILLWLLLVILNKLNIEMFNIPSINSPQAKILTALLGALCLVSSIATSYPEAAKADPTPAKTTAQKSSKANKLKINVNTAPIAELDKLELPGTKASLSERIQGARPYKTIDDLVTKKAISADELKLIKNLVTTGAK